jgi:glycosyltransferase involved in cell wall biosynthesis
MKPSLMVCIYQNPDYYPPTFNAVRILSEYFRVVIIGRNIRPCFAVWPEEVEVRRIGAYGDLDDKAAAGALAKLGEYRSFVRAIGLALDEFAPALVYAYEPHAFEAVLRAGARGRAIPVIYHLHEMPEIGAAQLTSLQTWIGRAALRHTIAAAIVIFPEANRAADYLAAARDSRPPLIVPNCPARDFCSPLSESEVVALASRRFAGREVIYAGSLGDSHSNREAVRAMTHLPATRLTHLGWAPAGFAEELRGLADDLNLADRCAVEASLPHRELAARMLEAAVGLALHKPLDGNLTHIATATNKLFEYAACAMPVVVPDLPNFHEFLADEPWVAYADPFEPEAIARAIGGLLSDAENYTRMSLAARRFFTDRFYYERAFAPALARVLALAGLALVGPAIAANRKNSVAAS